MLDDEVMRVGDALAGSFPSSARHPLRALDAKAMELAEGDQELRAALFRLVDVTPACRSLDDLARHLIGYLEEVEERPPPLAAAMRVSGTGAGRRALGAAATAGVRHMAHRFIVGESPKAALRAIESQWRDGIGTSLDLLGEATVTQDEADRYAARCDDAFRTLASAAQRWPERPRLEADSMGPIARVNVSVKVTALTPLIRPEAPEVGREDAAGRLRPLLRTAKELGAHLHVDMESVDSLETTQELIFELLDEPEFADGPSVGLVLQAYLRESPDQLERVLAWARESDRTPPVTIRLVKGAYWDHEVVEARQHGWSAPVFEDKADCDRNFELLTRTLIDSLRTRPSRALGERPDSLRTRPSRAPGERRDARPLVRVAIASHNLRSVSHAIAYQRQAGGDERDLELQVLRGLGDELAQALAKQGLRVRSYCPVGDLVAGMAYLVRRLLENTANESFLSDWRGGADLAGLLAAP